MAGSIEKFPKNYKMEQLKIKIIIKFGDPFRMILNFIDREVDGWISHSFYRTQNSIENWNLNHLQHTILINHKP
jgi:hypothetical protein